MLLPTSGRIFVARQGMGYVVCPRRLPSSLLTPTATVRVDDLSPVSFREKAFKRLVIKEEYKRLITAMVQAYMLEQPGFSDIVTGKGR